MTQAKRDDEMTIYNPDGGIILDAPVTKEAVEKFTLMGDWYVLLPFVSLSALDIPEGSYITYKGKKWEIMDPVYPESSGAGYSYSLQFDDQQNKLKKSICFWLGGPNPEAVFSDTTDLTSFGNLIVANMNREFGSDVWVFGGLENVDSPDLVKVVSFSGDTCWDAVNNIANTFDCEWWTEQNGEKVSLFFGKLERGSGEIFKEGEVVSQMPARSSNNTDGYGTRFYVFGSTRNLTSDYGQADQGGATNHVSEIRLRLPNNQQYIDARPGLTQSEVTPVVVFFDDVYPKNTDTVTSVEEKTITPEEGDPYPAYVVYASATPFVPSDVIEDDSFQIQFTSGDLTGLTFDVSINYDPATWKPEDGFDKKLEIVAQIETSGDSVSIIPNANMKPKSGDTFVLTGVKLPEQRIEEAEQELLAVGTEYAQKHSGDTNVYDCPTNPVYCAANEKNYDAGQVVILQDIRFGPDGRRSRIQGYEKKLYNEYVATYTVGDNRTYSRTGKIENDVKQNIYSQRIGTTTSGAAIYLITRYDQTPATDYNAYSAMRALWQFANKQTDERFKGNVTFDKDVTVGGAVVSKDFRPGGFSGSGFGFYRDANGNAVGEVDIIKARKEAVFNTAVINQVTFQVGATVFSNGGCEIARVEELDDVFRCYYDTKEGRRLCGLVVDDQARCQRYDATQNRIVKYYWRLVVAVGEDYVDLSKTDVDGSGVPEAGDEIAQFGHRTDKTRQGATIIDPKDGSSVVVYSEINSYSLSKKNFVGMGTNPTTGRPYLYCYGDFFLGDRELKNQFLTFQIPEGQTVPQLIGELNIRLGAGSSGLNNLTEWAEKQQQIDDAANAQFSSINLIDGSREMIVPMGGGRANYKAFPLGRIIAGEQLSISVESIDLLGGDSTSGYSAIIYDSTGGTEIKAISNQINFAPTGPFTGVFNVTDSAEGATLILYSGIPWVDAINRSVSYKKVMLVRGNRPCLTWVPSVNDQRQDTIDSVNIDTVNLVKRGDYEISGSKDYRIQRIFLHKELKKGEKYTLILSGAPGGSQQFRLYDDSDGSMQGVVANLSDRIYRLTFVFTPIDNTIDYKELRLYSYPKSSVSSNPSDLDWVCLYEGDVRVPYTFLESQYDINEDIDKVQQTVSDLDYLTQVFPNSLDVNGVVLAQLLGVKSSTAADAAVVAGFYGGSDDTLNNAGFKNPTHGILMWFSGAQNVQSAASAKTRVYGDGSIFTQMLYANGGQIGGFTISDYSMQANTYIDPNSPNSAPTVLSSLYMSADLLRYTGTPNTQVPVAEPHTLDVRIGTSTQPGVSRLKCPVHVQVSTSYPGAVAAGLFIDVQNTLGIGDESDAAYGSHAMMIAHGDICGLRLRTRRVKTYTILSDYDNVILCAPGSSKYSIVLPSDPQDGHILFIKSVGGSYYLQAPTGQYINKGLEYRDTTWDIGENGRLIIMVFDKVNKVWHAGHTSWN